MTGWGVSSATTEAPRLPRLVKSGEDSAMGGPSRNWPAKTSESVLQTRPIASRCGSRRASRSGARGRPTLGGVDGRKSIGGPTPDIVSR